MLEIDPTTLMLPAILAVTILALLMSGIAVVFQIRRSRLPDATRYEHVHELLAQKETLLETRRAELSEVEQKIQERDRLFAEVGALEERSEALKAELALSEPARQEIEEVKADAARAAEALAEVNQELREKQAELAQVTTDLDPAHLEELRTENETLTAERKGLMETLPELRAERDAALRVIEEARLLTTRQEVLKEEIARLEAEITRLRDDREALREAEDQLARARDEVARLQDEAGRLAARRDTLSAEIQNLEPRESELADLRRTVQEVGAELAQKREDRNVLAEEADRLVARIEGLKAEQERLSGVGAGPVEKADRLKDLTILPVALAAPVHLRGAVYTESEALHAVEQSLEDHGLRYSRRTVRAFHTALKINDHAQLTVLAGVSGTGKSLLPRRYAEAIGIHFLQIAVEPRWDSPQDLLGFYNYVEKTYRGTEFSRLMVHMDPYRSVQVPADRPDRREHMALVLLDEMNLARIEYYFSELLSRLEVRPLYEQADDPAKRRDAMIPIDIRGLEEALSLFPSHNVLFAGTVNEDESTQALSEKVLDRSNVMQFAAPQSFENSTVQNVRRADEALKFETWRSWIRPDSALDEARREKADRVILALARIMENCGRPFGHRLRDAMLAYVANYPVEGNVGLDVHVPLADQIEFRIMPKLRGLEIDDHRQALDELGTLLRGDLADGQFADRFEDLRDRQGRGSGLFAWRGLMRQG